MSMEEIKWNHINCPIKTKEGRKRGEITQQTYSKNKTARNMIDFYPIILVTFNMCRLNTLVGRTCQIALKITTQLYGIFNKPSQNINLCRLKVKR